MPERDAVTCSLGDGYELIAAGIRREKSGDLTADLLLRNGRLLYADRGVLNTIEGRRAWATAAEVQDGPTAARMEEALTEYMLLDALGALQDDGPKKPTQADLLVGMVSDLASDVASAAELFHDPGGSAFATIPVGDHRETWPLHSKGFRQWMARCFHEQHGKTPNAQALIDATNVLAGKAIFDGPEYRVHLRLAEHEGVAYLDLGNESWDAIAIDGTGWRVVANPPMKFRRTRGMLPLPMPSAGGSLNDLRAFINLPEGDAGDGGDDAPWVLTVAWLVGAFLARGPYPVLVALGEQGSAKSTLLRVLRALFDPNKAPVRSLPRDERDLMIAATNGWCLAFDNLSHLQDWQSDALCRISTGGGFAARELYSDQDETILDVQRPIALNGIEEVVTRNDLLDRSVMVTLPSIPPERRQPEKRFWRDFEHARPAILGAVLDAVSTALANEATVTLDGHPRMADFAEWIVAAEPALPWKPGSFLKAYLGNQQDANALTLEASPIAQAVREFMEHRPSSWEGTATQLLVELEAITGEPIRRQKSWPSSGRALSNILRRLAPNLRMAGVDVTFDVRKHGGKRVMHIETESKENPSSPSSPSSPPSPSAPNRGMSGDDEIGGDDGLRHPRDASSPSSDQYSLQWCENSGCGDDGDDGDDDWPIDSNEDPAQPELFNLPAAGDPDRWTR